MRLAGLRLHDVRRFAGRGVALEGIGQGVNVFCAANEQGKSTCFDALHALFFVPHTSEAAAVQALRPYSGGAPMIEADIETDSGRYRLAKRFWSGRRASVTNLGNGQLVAQAGEAEHFIQSLARGGTAGPAGLLWVRQGNTGLDRRQRDEDGERRARATVLSSVRGEVEALTGGRRMAEAVRACEEELARLVTPTGRPKAGGPYALAIEECERRAAEERRLAGETEALHHALDARRRARLRLAEIDDPNEEAARREALARATAAHEAAMARAGEAEAATLGARHLSERSRVAAAALLERRSLQQRAEEAAEKRAAALHRRDEAMTRRREAGDGADAAEAAALAAEREEAAARDVLARLERALRAREDAERLAALAVTLKQAQEARDEVERLEARQRGFAQPQAELRRLEALEIEIVGLQAAAAAKTATLRIDYLEGAEGTVGLDGKALAGGEERPLPASSRIEVEGVGTLTLRLPHPAEEATALEATLAKRAVLLGRLGVENLAAARLREEEAREAAAQLDLARRRLALLAPQGLAALRDEEARLATRESGRANTGEPALEILPPCGEGGPERSGGPDGGRAGRQPGVICGTPPTPVERFAFARPSPQGGGMGPTAPGLSHAPTLSPDQARARLAAASSRIGEARAAAHAARPRRERADAALIEAETALARAASDVEALESLLGPEADRADRLAALERNAAAAAAEAERAADRARTLGAATADLPALEAALRQARSRVEAAATSSAHLREELAKLSGQISTRSEEAVEEAFAEAVDALAAAAARVAAYAREVATLVRLREALQAARTSAREHYFEPVMRELAPLLGLVFEDASVSFDDATLSPVAIRRGALEEPVERLSGGAREQLAILTRLAFARLLAREGHPAPVILDDALVYSDDERIERMFEALFHQPSGQQIIVFSCRQRAFARLGGNVLRLVPWEPGG